MREDVDSMQEERSRDEEKETHGNEQERKKENTKRVDGQSGDTALQWTNSMHVLYK